MASRAQSFYRAPEAVVVVEEVLAVLAAVVRAVPLAPSRTLQPLSSYAAIGTARARSRAKLRRASIVRSA
jgi:hypothetical protein